MWNILNDFFKGPSVDFLKKFSRSKRRVFKGPNVDFLKKFSKEQT